jgi:hypothetical protein
VSCQARKRLKFERRTGLDPVALGIGAASLRLADATMDRANLVLMCTRSALGIAIIAALASVACSSSGDSQNGTAANGIGGSANGGGLNGVAAAAGVGFGAASGTGARSGAGGGGALTDANSCAAVTEGTQNTLSPADIIIAVDQSTSMADETPIIQDRLDDLAAMLGPSARLILIAERVEGVDAVTLNAVPTCAPEETTIENPITIPPPLGTDATRFRSINCHVDSTDAWESIIDTFPLYQDFLRPEATKHVVVITDDSSDMAVNAFDSAFRALNPALTSTYIHDSIVPFDTGCPFASGDPQRYRQLTQQTGGVEADLCAQDFQMVWEALAAHVAATTKLTCEWTIPPPPTGLAFNKGLVNVRYTSDAGSKDLGFVASAADCAGAADAWHYDNASLPTKVLACPELCAEIQAGRGQKIEILFGCETKAPVIH